MTDYNKIVTTVNSITPDYQFIPDLNNTIVIDTSENRIGINTITPDESIHVSGGTIKTKDSIVLGDLSVNRFSSDLIPRDDLSYNFGTIDKRINDCYIGSDIYLDKTRIIKMGDYAYYGYTDISTLIIDNSGKHLDISDIRHVNIQGDVSINSNLDISSQLICQSDVSFMDKFYTHNDASFNNRVDVQNQLTALSDVSFMGKLLVINDSSFNKDMDISGILNLTHTLSNMSITGTKIYTLFEPNDQGDDVTRLIIDPAKYNDQVYTSDQGEVVIKGNLKVIGNHTTMTSTNVEISDNIMIMNANWNDVPYGGIGVNINRFDAHNNQITKQFLYNQNKTTITDDSLDKYRKNTQTSYIRERALNNEYWDTRGISINFGNPLLNNETGTGGIIDSDFIYVDNIKLDANKISTTHGNLEIDAIGSNKIDIKNNTHITGNKTLTVTGATYLDNILDVDGVTTLRSTLNVNGGTYLNNILDVDGVTTLRSTLNVNGVSNLNNTLNVNGGAYLNNILDVDGVTTLRNTLNVNGGTYLNNILDVDGATTLNSTLGVTGATTLGNTLNVNGATTLNSTLGVTGATTLGNTLNVNGATTLNSTLGVTGATTLGNTLNVNGATTLTSTLGVTGATTLNSTLGVTGETTLGNTLNVDGVSNLKNALNADGATSLNNTLTVGGQTTLNGTTNIKYKGSSVDLAVKLEELESVSDGLEDTIATLTTTVATLTTTVASNTTAVATAQSTATAANNTANSNRTKANDARIAADEARAMAVANATNITNNTTTMATLTTTVANNTTTVASNTTAAATAQSTANTALANAAAAQSTADAAGSSGGSDPHVFGLRVAVSQIAGIITNHIPGVSYSYSYT